MARFQWMHVSSAIHQYLLWPFGLKGNFIKGEAPLQHTFAPCWINPLEYLAETTTRTVACTCRLWNIGMCDYQESVTTGQRKKEEITNGQRQTDADKGISLCRYALAGDIKNRIAAFQVFRSEEEFLWSPLWLFLPWIHPRANPKHMCRTMRNFIPTKFHKHPSSGSVVKTDYVCVPMYIHGLVHPTPFLHLNNAQKVIRILQAFKIFYISIFSLIKNGKYT